MGAVPGLRTIRLGRNQIGVCLADSRGTLTVYIGHDKREADAIQVCRLSLLDKATKPVPIIELREDELRTLKLYDRPFTTEGNQRIDSRDHKPFSTDFSFNRFLVPCLNLWQGWALFCDGDFLWRGDVNELLSLRDESKAVQVVKHDYTPKDSVKMDGQRQESYPRKNWSSLILWNCAHPSNRKVTPRLVNFMPGSYLHAFGWLKDEEIGALPEAFNWLEGHSTSENPQAVHMTRGVPSMPGYEQIPYADEWRGYLK